MTRDEEIRQAEAHDHARAGERGERLRRIGNEIVSQLIVHGLIGGSGDCREARLLTFRVLADNLYGNAAIDIPNDLGEAVTTAITYPAAIKFYLTDAAQRSRVLRAAARLQLTVLHRPHTVAFDVIVRSIDEAVALGLACRRPEAVPR